MDWEEARAYLARKLENVQRGMEDAVEPNVWRLQGKASLLRELLQLPNLLAHEKQMDQLAKEARG